MVEQNSCPSGLSYLCIKLIDEYSLFGFCNTIFINISGYVKKQFIRIRVNLTLRISFIPHTKRTLAHISCDAYFKIDEDFEYLSKVQGSNTVFIDTIYIRSLVPKDDCSEDIRGVVIF